ncbi:MAG: ABC transporter permease [Candidatus Sedimenticola endophacoides]|uniref:Lipoprotein-releasing system transmembrane subunit LolC n=1 Tax=Candidatus Sedimenticola endophacoides TaxID=2548426 RepID=A0A6N4E331_9GAMM|nr:MAG: ABC transporter permease [Candidatus Sedimenticola endophacoides]OQX33405.1 MAG: ABC transporter permease [Candidatus Sedimenticola endophacoides]OQX41373.1 MAG: ABC transporter permease [Candidatus Sedimenticola endophacoides]OQX41894.1 MAG: ABC transporter permease [Candidatus Sedimenticola endophacoides]PUD98342.1 MAG: lipoprotein-releasing system transmembrane subunit LolC [Candidatus Sedimenticola endophacoides]
MFRPLELFIGLRYTRARRRNHFISFISLSSVLGIMLGVVALITVLSVMNGFHKEIRERILGMASHASISAFDGHLEDWREAMRLSEGHPRVIGQAPFIEAQTMLINGRQVTGAMLRGIDPLQEGRVSDVGGHMKAGSLEALEAGRYEIVLGRELAYALGVSVGDKVTVVSPQVRITPVGTMPRLKRFTVSGLFEVGMGEYDRGVALVHIADAAKLMSMGESVSGVRLKLDDLYLAPRVSRELAAELPGLYRVSDWTHQHRNFFSALQTEKRMMGLILFLIIAVAAFNIVSTLVMVVTDKQSDIAILRTLGASPRSIMGVFIVQGATLGVIGTLFGVLGGVLLSLNLERIVAGIEKWLGINFLDPSIYYISSLPSDLRWDDVLFIGASALAITLLATLYPAWRASRTQPAEALRYE